MRSRIIIIAHRGASSYVPENTIEAFKLAFSQKVDAIEMDVRKTLDGGFGSSPRSRDKKKAGKRFGLIGVNITT